MVKLDFHWSHISMLMRCGIQFEFRVIKGIVIPPGVAVLVGSSTHKGIDVNLNHKIKTGELMPLDDVMEAAAEDLNKRWQDGVELDSEERSVGESNVRGDAVDTVVALSSLHHKEVAPRINPSHVERKFVLELEGFSRNLTGTIDVVEVGGIVRDTKTAKRSPPAETADNSDQLTMYGLAIRTLDKVNPVLILDHLVKTKVPKAVTQMTTRTSADYQVLLNRVAAASRVIQSGAFMPCAQDSWCCSPAWCGYYSQCIYARKKIQVPI
jgi:hypothetical protein